MNASSVTLNIWDSAENNLIKIQNVDLNSKVENLKNEAIKKLNNHNFVLLYCGLVMEDEQLLSYYGLKAGVTVHAIRHNFIPITTRVKDMSETEIQQLVVSFRTLTGSTGYRAALQRLARPEVLETIIAATPGLAEDPGAIAIIQDPELIVHMANPDTVRRVAEKHPCLIEASNYIVAHIHEEQANITASQASTSTGYSYSLDAFSDDEDMETDREPNPLSRNTSYNAITAAQLAAAIASATNTTFNTNSAGMPSTPNSSLGSGTSGNQVITSEMFSNAIQQAFASNFGGAFVQSGGGTNSIPTTPNRNEVETLETLTRRLQPQLQQMHEIGLTNDVLNVRALQATSGDVEAAIEFVFQWND